MNQPIGLISKKVSAASPAIKYQSLFMGGALVGLNLILIILFGLYWTNPQIHQMISGGQL